MSPAPPLLLILFQLAHPENAQVSDIKTSLGLKQVSTRSTREDWPFDANESTY